ncbi:addiction module protein [Ornithinimicrobium murale]|uniref:addiction module protein n=1 Tax=Ornithinimicrobium murale TaxID=1050153 RepID=UPI000E0D67B9|nr:addiction module protein [Ornithinimicrobium murale]
MAPEVAEVERALLALSPDERAAVIERGLLSLHDAADMDRANTDTAWLAEVDRRATEHTSGDAHLVDAGEHFAELRARLAARER